MKYRLPGFSLVEILVGILIVSIVMVAGFQALSAIGIGKIKLIEKTKVEKQAYFAAEKFFEMIKKGGTIDYEEYWNRYSFSTAYSSGHFSNASGFGNFGDNRPSVGNTTYGQAPYHCLSGPSDPMGTNGCLLDNNIRFGLAVASMNESKAGPQRYTQYERQFIDRNSDADNDSPLGDEDGDGSIVDDDDDLQIGIGPQAFPNATDVGELYLINKEKNERTYFRWSVVIDTDAPPSSVCTGTNVMTGVGCLGTIEFLKLRGEDYGYDHNSGVVDGDGSQGDGVIDTWLIHEDFLTTAADVVAGSNATSYWQPIFPNSINVSNVEFYLFPNKDLEYSWRDTNAAIQMAPYLQIKMTLQPSWKEKRKIKGAFPTVDIATTIQLLDLDFR